MMFFQGRGYKYFYYISGIIVLSLSMLALYSATQLMETKRTVREKYKYYAEVFMEMEDAIHKFEKTFLNYIAEEPDTTFLKVKSEFKVLSEILDELQKNRHVNLHQMKDDYLNYELTLYRVNMETAHLADSLNSYEKGQKKDPVHDRMMYVQYERLEVIHNDVSKLQNIVIRSFVHALLEGRIKEKRVWCYWLIFVMGFCGFVLLISNSCKVKELEKLNSEKKGAMDLLQERLAALEAATDGIFIVDAQSNITYMNGAFFKIISGGGNSHNAERKRKELFGKPWRKVFSKSDVEVIEEDILSELQEKGSWIGSFQIFAKNKTGKGTWTDMSLTQLPEGGIIGTVQDVSYKKNAEKEKKQLEEQFYQAQKMEAIGRLAGGVAHDFNNILAAMNGYAEFLIDDLKEGSEQHGFAENILAAGRQARSLVDQMLAFSRRGNSEHDVVDVRQSLEEAIGMISVSLPKTIELKTGIRAGCLLVRGNPTQILQMIMNLCVNAQDAIEDDRGNLYIYLDVANTSAVDIPGVMRKEMPDPTETPYLRIDDMGAGHARMVIGHLMRDCCYAKLTIQDSGTGISRVVMEHIFEPFFTTKSVDKGTGLGMATVHGSLAAHSGFMVIDSKLGSGTRFDVYFPLLVEAEENSKAIAECYGDKLPEEENRSTKINLVENDEKEKLSSQTKAGRKKGKKKNKSHILLVEDQENVRDMIITMLKRLGHNVSSANTGMEGLDMIRENPTAYDLVITDYNMPKMTGLEMAHQVSLDMPDLRFVLLSGYNEEKMCELIKEHKSFKAVLRKPVSKKILEEVIKEVIKEGVK
ncbi:MAG: response regulator [Alphaproteobacteria bacterium]|nr:response regulator [Alphaproteobacteria bacterium]